MELSNKKRVSFTKKADCIFLLNHSPTENFIRDDSHKEQSAALKFRKHMSQMHFSHEENSQFAMTRAQVLCQTVTDDAANNEHNESFAVWQEEPWSILGKLARVKAVDLIRSRKSASTARPLSSEGAREPISAKQKHVRFSEHVVTCFEYAPTEQFRFSSAHHSKLRIFNARVQMSRMFHHGINEDEASKRAIDCRAAVEEYAAEVSFEISESLRLKSFKLSETPDLEMIHDSELLNSFAILDDACVGKRLSARAHDSVQERH